MSVQDFRSGTAGVPISDAMAVAGRPDHFAVLFDRYAAQLYRYCSARVGRDLANDVVAETFLLAYERRDRYDSRRPNALPWLYGIATNVLRRHRHAEIRAHRGYAMVGSSPGLDPDSVAERVAERADAAALTRTLAGQLASMSQRHRDVLFLTAAGLDYEQIASALEVPVGTVRSRLHRARTRLRRALDTTAAGSAAPSVHPGDDHAS